MFSPSLALLLVTPQAFTATRPVTVTIAAGDFDRRGTIVIFPIPSRAGSRGNPAKPALSPAAQGEFLRDGTNGIFLLDSLARGASRTYALQPRDEPAGHVVPLTDGSGKALPTTSRPNVPGATVHARRVWTYFPSGVTKSLLEYQLERGTFPRPDIKPIFERGCYLHPIRTLSGRTVTDDFPPNHVHHHGVWWAWTKAEFDGRKPDFWNMGDGKGRVDFVGRDEWVDGEPLVSLRARHDFIDLTATKPATALHETWLVTPYAPDLAKGYWLFDLVSEQRCATEQPLKLPEYYYGGLGLRGNWAWNGKTNVNFLTSEGETDRVKGNTQKGRWCDMWGRIDGADCGIAILCHPGNFRAPQPMRLHPTEPFFCYAPQQGGDMEIKPAETYVSRYRFVVHDGQLDKAELDRLWNDYAQPPTVKVQRD